MGFISSLLLPHEVDFNAALRTQAHTSAVMVNDLYRACVNEDRGALESIAATAQQARDQKSANMAQLLDVFITPYDKESIYRMITQLDWIALSVRHFQLETEVYDIHSLSQYQPILAVLQEMVGLLEEGIGALPAKQLQFIAVGISQIRDRYDQVVELCATATAALLAQDDIKHIIRHKDMLVQLKEIAKRIHITANTLEDMAIKVV